MTEKELLLVGSIPLETAEEVFRTWGGALGKHLPCMPDGEVGDRINWIDGLAYRVFNGHPELETLTRPAADNGVERWVPRNLADEWSFRVRPGIEAVRFGDPGWRLGYAKDAVNSYFVFRTLKENGVIPADVRFQVALPLTNSCIVPYFHEPADHPRIKPGFEAAMRAEIAKMIDKIPPGDLAIQWDCAVEIQDLEGNSYSYLPREQILERHIAPIRNLSPQIPEQVMLGYHLCFGTLGGWPMTAPRDLNLSVEFANAAIAQSGRRVDFVHIPALDTAGDQFYAPLRNLKPQGARVYLGMIHNLRDTSEFRTRLLTARKYLSDFGLSAPCGFGRTPAAELPGILKQHLSALEIMRGL
ncbi:MAG: hypothetical protein ACREP6_16210 [Candidatus Binataceae bacterium]